MEVPFQVSERAATLHRVSRVDKSAADRILGPHPQQPGLPLDDDSTVVRAGPDRLVAADSTPYMQRRHLAREALLAQPVDLELLLVQLDHRVLAGSL